VEDANKTLSGGQEKVDRSREPHYLVGLTQIATATSELPPVAFALSLCLQLYCPSGPEFGLLVFATPGRLLLALCFFFFFYDCLLFII